MAGGPDTRFPPSLPAIIRVVADRAAAPAPDPELESAYSAFRLTAGVGEGCDDFPYDGCAFALVWAWLRGPRCVRVRVCAVRCGVCGVRASKCAQGGGAVRAREGGASAVVCTGLAVDSPSIRS